MGNSWHHSVQNVLPCHLQSKNIKNRIYETRILPVFLYGFETWFPTLRNEYSLSSFEGRVLSRIFKLKKAEVVGS
jgi:hypothetical protein